MELRSVYSRTLARQLLVLDLRLCDELVRAELGIQFLNDAHRLLGRSGILARPRDSLFCLAQRVLDLLFLLGRLLQSDRDIGTLIGME